MSTTADPVTGEVTELAELSVSPVGAGALSDVSPGEVSGRLQAAAVAFADLTKQLALYAPVTKKGDLALTSKGWRVAGLLMGVTARTVSASRDGDGWIAIAEATRLTDGQVVGGAVGACNRDEEKWKDEPSFKVLGMASTRAQTRALEAIVSPVVQIAETSAGAEKRSVEPPATGGRGGPAGGEFASEKQVKMLHAKAKAAGLEPVVFLQHVFTVMGAGPPPEGDAGQLVEKALARLPKGKVNDLVAAIEGGHWC